MRVFFKAFIAIIFIVGLSTTAHAQSQTTTPGCGDEQYEAAQLKRQADAAVGVAIHEEVHKQPDSVLATSCFDQAARVDAQEGAFFSGPFVDQMTPVVLQPMQNLLNMNFMTSIGKDPDFGQIVTTVLSSLLGGLFGGGMSGGSFNCSMQQDLFDADTVQGINGNIQLGSTGFMMGLGMNGGGNTTFMRGLQAAAPIFQSLQQAVDNIPAPLAAPSVNACGGNTADPFTCILGVIGFAP